MKGRGLHLGEAPRRLAEYEHDLRDALVGGKAQGGGAGIEVVVFSGVEVVGQSAVVARAVDLVDDFVGAREVVAAGDDLIQPNRLGGQGDSDR